ncbi:hypothetical protein I204_08143 [Kwoniella mangroviensis CBS 8886]|uniref:uncharacterized protein n=1 Tax=Kwoniella mangroviensis CBS 8507 TaxID=1296122 RepID=UPI00080D2567|nr:uncharacterized protein I203_04497 [Kwoniella mangroviensis CBS 8507]OCF66171.1 hypothetical protein I203_04497 [Kwoniella mangroviensis CBS 8507]OCF71190.1 hypothetical protein I204_08143 [Kwoniella mangroviensis CBS 8886]
MPKRRATHLPSPAPSSSRINNFRHPHATTPLSQSRFKRPKLTHTSHSDVVSLPFSNPDSDDDQQLEDDEEEQDDILLTPREEIIPTITSSTSTMTPNTSTFVSPSPFKKRFKLNPRSMIHPDDIDLLIPTNYPTSTETDGIDLLTPPTRREIPYQPPTKVTPRKKMQNGRRVFTQDMTLDVLQEAMDFLCENFISERLSKKFNSYSTHPDALIQTNIRKKVMNMFGMDLAFLLPNLDHLDGIGLDRSKKKQKTEIDEGWEEMGREEILEDGRSLETTEVRDDSDERDRGDTEEEEESTYGNAYGSEDQDEDVSMGED